MQNALEMATRRTSSAQRPALVADFAPVLASDPALALDAAAFMPHEAQPVRGLTSWSSDGRVGLSERDVTFASRRARHSAVVVAVGCDFAQQRVAVCAFWFAAREHAARSWLRFPKRDHLASSRSHDSVIFGLVWRTLCHCRVAKVTRCHATCLTAARAFRRSRRHQSKHDQPSDSCFQPFACLDPPFPRVAASHSEQWRVGHRAAWAARERRWHLDRLARAE